MAESQAPADRLDSICAAELFLRPVFSYASDEVGPLSQHLIRCIEHVTGQPRIRRMYEAYTRLHRPPELFWRDAVAALDLDLWPSGTAAAAVPASGPLVVVANHPFGVVDGIVLCWLVSQVRADYQIMTHSILYRAPEVRPYILPVDFSGTRAATLDNVRVRQAARRLLGDGGALIVFPGGGVATSRGPFGPAIERDWGPLTAKLALSAQADVLPVWFGGQNSRLFQLAASLHQTLKYALLFHEVRNKIGARLSLALGDVIPQVRLREIGDPRAVATFLRQATLRLDQDLAHGS